MANDTAAGLLVFSRHAPSLQEYGLPAGPVTWVLHPEQVLPEFPPAECRCLTFSDAAGQPLRAKCVIVEQMAECFANPDDLFDLIDDMEFEFLILSVGERDASGGRNDYGPPANAAHYREWNSVEFKNYLRGWFKLTEHRIFNGESLLQVVICQKK